MATLTLKTRNRKRTLRRPELQSRLQEGRVNELLDIAVEEFIAHGFEGASINRIVRRGNASKTTFYSRFPTKEKLFLAVLERRMSFVFDEVSAALPVDPPIAKILREYGVRLVNLVLSEQQIGLIRVVSMEAQRFPQLAERFYELGPHRGHKLLTGYFEEQVRRGRVAMENPALMAEHFLSLITGGPVRKCILWLNRKPTPEDQSKHIDAAVKAFLRAYPPEIPKPRT